MPFETRILGGVTHSPRPGTYCKVNISDFSVCDQDQKEITIDENYCLTVDYLGRPVDIYSNSIFPCFLIILVGGWFGLGLVAFWLICRGIYSLV